MNEHDYVYQLRPLIVPAVVFLILYPLVIGSVHFFSKLPIIELRVLIGIYVMAALGILFLWVIGKSKRVQIKDRQIVFRSLLGKHILEPQDIRRVAFYFDGKGQEIAQIRTKDELYYVSEFYFPFPELMSDLENFIQKHDLRSNLESYAGLNN
jgi:energy-coupling factor transporter transmembrane protein EcfT